MKKTLNHIITFAVYLLPCLGASALFNLNLSYFIALMALVVASGNQINIHYGEESE